MSTPAYSALVAAIRGEGEAIASAARQGLELPVPTCPGWLLRDLCVHVGRIYGRVAHIVGERLTSTTDMWPEMPDDTDPVDWMTETLDHLVGAFAECSPDTPVWNWSPHPQEATFWARRMAHESSVHRFDAQRAHGVAQPVTPDLASDGLDELIDVLLPRVVERESLRLDDATYAFVSADDGTWAVRTSEAGAERLESVKEPDVTVTGTASALLLAAYNRVPWSSLEVDGDVGVLERWSAQLRF